MDVVGHDDESVKYHIMEMPTETVPCRFGYLTNLAQLHLPLDYIAQHAAAIPGADGDEVGSVLAVIVALVADAVPVAPIRLGVHSQRLPPTPFPGAPGADRDVRPYRPPQ